MLPNDELSVIAYPGTFNYPVKSAAPDDQLRGWELGGIALNDPSEGLVYQLWQCDLEIDEDTSVGYVFVQAPEVPKTLLFADLGITAVDIAFDQNMQPFVAYKQSGIWKYWWYDPTVSMMVHTTLPNARDLRCCLDDHRRFAIATADILLCYVNSSNQLCVRYQRDRYSIEYVLANGITENLVYVGMNSQGRVQFGLGLI